MNKVAQIDNGALLKGQVKLLQHLYGVMDGAAIRCALKLRIADILKNHDGPMTLSQIILDINSTSLNIDGLSRLMRFLVHRQIFDGMRQEEYGETLYSINHCSKWLLHDFNITLEPLAMMSTEPLFLSPLYNLNQSITEGGSTFKNTYGQEFFDFTSLNPNFNKIFHEGMSCQTRISMDAIMLNYNFHGLNGTLLDVGGGVGVAIHEIVTAYAHLKGINFDLPHVVASAPTYDGVTHVGGDMFKSIPRADSIFMKWILHDWSDIQCVEILKNCRQAIHGQTGKIIIIDIIMRTGMKDVFNDTRHVFDLLMLACSNVGKERTEDEWKKILEQAGFRRYNFIHIPALQSIIEAYSD